MFRIVAWLSLRARTMPRRSPLTSVTPALSIATSVPVPIAMPTSACASAGASLMPSPAIATLRPSRLELLDGFALLLGQHLRLDVVDAELSRDRFGRRPVVSREHDDAHALVVQRLIASAVDALIGSATPRSPAARPSIATKHDRLPVARAAPPPARATAPASIASSLEQPAFPIATRPAVDGAGHALAGERLEIVRRRLEIRRALAAPATIACGERVLAARSRLAASRRISASSIAGETARQTRAAACLP